MKSSNSMISFMFEEIKNQLSEIRQKLDENKDINSGKQAPEKVQASGQDEKEQAVSPDQVIRAIAFHLQKLGQKCDSVLQAGWNSEKLIRSDIDQLKMLTESQKPDKNVYHRHSLELKSFRVVIGIASLAILLLISFIVNFHLLEVNSRMKDNDIKYRYIWSTNGISKENLYKLEDCFTINRDRKKIQKIINKVERFEKLSRENTLILDKNNN